MYVVNRKGNGLGWIQAAAAAATTAEQSGLFSSLFGPSKEFQAAQKIRDEHYNLYVQMWHLYEAPTTPDWLKDLVKPMIDKHYGYVDRGAVAADLAEIKADWQILQMAHPPTEAAALESAAVGPVQALTAAATSPGFLVPLVGLGVALILLARR